MISVATPRRKALLALIALTLALSRPTVAAPKQSNEPVTVTQNGLSVAVDPRIELVSIVQYLSDYRSISSALVTTLSSSYRNDVDEWFGKYKGHRVIDMFNKMSSKGFSYDAPPHAVMYLKPDFSLDDVIFTDDAQDVSRDGGKDQMAAFATALRAFAEESDFAAFYAKHHPLYKRIADETITKIGNQDILNRIEKYYGEKRSSYTVVISPLLGRGSFGIQTERAKGDRDIYCVMGPYGLGDDNTPLFGSRQFFDQLQRHEFGHSFVNPMAARHERLVEAHSKLYGALKAKMEPQAYGDWRTVVNESILRAVTTRLAYIIDGREAGDKELGYHRQLGFVFTDALVKKLEVYEKNRDKYPTLDSFYPELIAAFDDFTPDSVTKMIGSAGVVISDIEAHPCAIAYELPEEKGRADAEAYVRKVHDVFWSKNELVDTGASDWSLLNAKLKDNCVLYTTIGSKLFNAATKPLNIRITDGTLTWKGVSTPIRDLRIVLVGRNPFGDGLCVLYAGGTNESLVGINACFHGPCSYHIFKGDKLLKEGHYNASFEATDGG